MAVLTDNSDDTSSSGESKKGRLRRKRKGSGGAVLASGRRLSPDRQSRPRSRSWGLVILAALLLVGSGLAVAAWGLNAGDRVSVLAVGTAVPKGQAVERDDLVSVSVAGVSGSIPVGDIDTVVGKRAAVDLVEGQVLTGSMVTDDPVPGDGQATIGLALEPNRVPGAGLDPGDYVDVVAVPNSDAGPQGGPGADKQLNKPSLISGGAMVYEVGGKSVDGAFVLVTLVVNAKDARRITAYSTLNRVALVETAPTGTEPGSAASSPSKPSVAGE